MNVIDGKATLHLCIADLKILHTFIICHKLPKLIFYSASISRKDTNYLTAGTKIDNYSYREKAHSWSTPEWQTTSQSSILHWKIPPRNKGPKPIRIKGCDLRDHMSYFIHNQHTKKGLDPNICVIYSIYDIKGKSTLHVLVANYTNKHVTFKKGQCIGHIEPSMDNMPQTSVNSIIT